MVTYDVEGTGPLYFINGTMNQKQYKIENILMPYLNDLHI